MCLCISIFLMGKHQNLDHTHMLPFISLVVIMMPICIVWLSYGFQCSLRDARIVSFVVPYCRARIGIKCSDQSGSMNSVIGAAHRTKGALLGRCYHWNVSKMFTYLADPVTTWFRYRPLHHIRSVRLLKGPSSWLERCCLSYYSLAPSVICSRHIKTRTSHCWCYIKTALLVFYPWDFRASYPVIKHLTPNVFFKINISLICNWVR